MSQPREWKTIKEYQDILFEFYKGIAKITINRPRYRNAFTPTTTTEISDALYYCRARERPRRICRYRRSSPPECARRTETDSFHPETSNCHGQRICYRWRTRASRSLRPDHCFRKCYLRSDRSSRRQLRCRIWFFLPGSHRRPEESPRNLVPLPPVFCPGSTGYGTGQQSRTVVRSPCE